MIKKKTLYDQIKEGKTLCKNAKGGYYLKIVNGVQYCNQMEAELLVSTNLVQVNDIDNGITFYFIPTK